MRKVNKKLIFVLSSLFLLLITLNSADAAMIGVNRAQIQFDDVLRNGYAEENFVVSIGSEHDVEFFFEPRGEVASWVRLEPDEQGIPVNRDNPLTMKVIVEPPSDVQSGSYEGHVLVLTGSLDGERGRMGTEVVAAFEVKLRVEITDTQILNCNVGGLRIESTEVGFPTMFTGRVTNRGNVRINPEIEFEIYDQAEENVVLTDTYIHEQDILPTASESIETTLEWDLNPGQYWIRISENACSGSAYQTFSILERGAIQDVGELIRIQNDAWGRAGEITPINAHFRNTGERVVTAQFRGTISKEGKIVEVLESPQVNVDPGETSILEMFYTPEEEGQYSIKGRVHYNNKLTHERGSILNVNEGLIRDLEIDLITVLFITGLTFLVLMLFLIYKKKKR